MESRVLYAEDDASIRLPESKRISKRGYEAISAGDGEEALAKFREERREGRTIDLVITDINMPKINGEKLIEILREEEKFEWETGIASGSYISPEFINRYRILCVEWTVDSCLEAYERLKANGR